MGLTEKLSGGSSVKSSPLDGEVPTLDLGTCHFSGLCFLVYRLMLLSIESLSF